MRKLLTSFSPGLNRLREILFKGLFRARFRYDVFISYSHSDAKEYAVNLKRQLGLLDFTCFIDEEESPPGLSLGPTLEKALRQSATLVLLATERALTRPYVALEVEKFIPTGRTIVPINIRGALATINSQAFARQPWDVIEQRKLIWIDESDDAFSKNNPSPPIADGIDKLFKYTRRNVRVRAEILGTAALVLLAAFGAGFIIKGQAAEVSKQSTLAEAARNETAKQQGLAAAAGSEAQRQLALASQATKEAEGQRQVAETAKKDAERQQSLARAATLEAKKQQEIARAATQEAKKQQDIAQAATTEANKQQGIAQAATTEANKQQELARVAKVEADRQTAIAAAELERTRHIRYDSDISLAQSANALGDMTRAYQLLSPYLPHASTAKNDSDLRNFAWYYLWNNSFGELATLGTAADIEVEMSSTAFSPDGKMLAVAREGDTIALWDMTTRQEWATLRGHEGEVYKVSFSPDGKLLASAGKDQTVKLWDIAAKKELTTLRGHSGAVTSVSFSPDNALLVSSGEDQTVRLWDSKTRKELARITGSFVPFFSPDGKTLALVGDDAIVRLWDVAKRRDLVPLNGCSERVRSVDFSLDGKLLATGCDDDTIRLWNLGTRQEVATLEGKSNWGGSYSILFSPDGKTLAQVGVDNTIRLWDISTRLVVATLTAPEGVPHSAAFSPDGKILAACMGQDAFVTLWDVSSRLQAENTVISPGEAGALAFSPNGRTLAASDPKGIVFWNTTTWKEERRFKGGASSNAIVFSPDGSALATAAGSSVYFWNIASGKALAILEGESFAFSPTSTSLAVTRLHDIVFWDTVALKESARIKGEESQFFSSVAFSSDGKMLASVDHNYSDHFVKIWSVDSHKELATMKMPFAVHYSLSFSPDGTTFIVTFEEGATVWDVATWKEVVTLKSHLTVFYDGKFSPDGKTFTSAGLDGITLWDAFTWREQFTFPGSVTDTAFSPDGNTLAIAHFKDKIVLRFAADSEEGAVPQPAKQ